MNTSRSLISLALIGFSFPTYGSELPNIYTPLLQITASTTVASYGHYNLDEIEAGVKFEAHHSKRQQ